MCYRGSQEMERQGHRTWHKQSCGRPPQALGRARGGVYHSTTPSAGLKSGIDLFVSVSWILSHGIDTDFHTKRDQESVDWSVIGFICWNQIKLYLYSTFQTWMQHNGYTGKKQKYLVHIKQKTNEHLWKCHWLHYKLDATSNPKYKLVF